MVYYAQTASSSPHASATSSLPPRPLSLAERVGPSQNARSDASAAPTSEGEVIGRSVGFGSLAARLGPRHDPAASAPAPAPIPPSTLTASLAPASASALPTASVTIARAQDDGFAIDERECNMEDASQHQQQQGGTRSRTRTRTKNRPRQDDPPHGAPSAPAAERLAAVDWSGLTSAEIRVKLEELKAAQAAQVQEMRQDKREGLGEGSGKGLGEDQRLALGAAGEAAGSGVLGARGKRDRSAGSVGLTAEQEARAKVPRLSAVLAAPPLDGDLGMLTPPPTATLTSRALSLLDSGEDMVVSSTILNTHQVHTDTNIPADADADVNLATPTSSAYPSTEPPSQPLQHTSMRQAYLEHLQSQPPSFALEHARERARAAELESKLEIMTARAETVKTVENRLTRVNELRARHAKEAKEMREANKRLEKDLEGARREGRELEAKMQLALSREGTRHGAAQAAGVSKDLPKDGSTLAAGLQPFNAREQELQAQLQEAQKATEHAQAETKSANAQIDKLNRNIAALSTLRKSATEKADALSQLTAVLQAQLELEADNAQEAAETMAVYRHRMEAAEEKAESMERAGVAMRAQLELLLGLVQGQAPGQRQWDSAAGEASESQEGGAGMPFVLGSAGLQMRALQHRDAREGQTRSPSGLGDVTPAERRDQSASTPARPRNEEPEKARADGVGGGADVSAVPPAGAEHSRLPKGARELLQRRLSAQVAVGTEVSDSDSGRRVETDGKETG